MFNPQRVASPIDYETTFARPVLILRCELRQLALHESSHHPESFRLAKIRELGIVTSMESHELLREIFDKKTPKEVSADLSLSTSMIYKWTQPREGEGSGIENPLDRVEALYQSTGDHRLIQWLCQRAGGFFILNPKNTPHPHFLIPATNEIVQEFADLLQVDRRRRRRQSNHDRRGQTNPCPLGGVKIRHRRLCGMLRRGKFRADEKGSGRPAPGFGHASVMIVSLSS